MEGVADSMLVTWRLCFYNPPTAPVPQTGEAGAKQDNIAVCRLIASKGQCGSFFLRGTEIVVLKGL
jgi:hypothetical protein